MHELRRPASSLPVFAAALVAVAAFLTAVLVLIPYFACPTCSGKGTFVRLYGGDRDAPKAHFKCLDCRESGKVGLSMRLFPAGRCREHEVILDSDSR